MCEGKYTSSLFTQRKSKILPLALWSFKFFKALLVTQKQFCSIGPNNSFAIMVLRVALQYWV